MTLKGGARLSRAIKNDSHIDNDLAYGDYISHHDDMKDTASIAARLKEARKAAGYKSAAEAAKILRMNPVTTRSHENGQNGFPRDAAAKYARTYNVSVEWLLFGEGSASAGPDEFSAIAARAGRSEAALAYAKTALRKLLSDLEAM